MLVALMFGVVFCALGLMFNIFAAWVFIQNRIDFPRGLYVCSVLPFGAWLFVVGVLIGAFINAYIVMPRRRESLC